MDEPKRPRGRPATGRREYKKLNLRLTPEQYNFIDKVAKQLNKPKAQLFIDALTFYIETESSIK